ncbi:gliding motility-associated C-terminal domain-containing protein [Carboxylicivirga sp. M1479]|uniref:T9SS type B sorting domain-containing protein n=1 Tax=Carboxylicivirga sp. M1479 TaxID=2594476 RepID=UPI00163D64BC|nr:gliding motility-associated C-terminal domain-containing protein [Carboxylicivirga sp. M1479]
MKKYLHIILTLSLWIGVTNLYAQGAKATVGFDQLRFCESGTVTMTIRFEGPAPYEFKYSYAGGIYSEPDWNSDVFTKEFTFDTDVTIEVFDFKDVNGVDGDVVNGLETVLIDQMPTPTISPNVLTCRKEVTLSADPGGEFTDFSWTASESGVFDPETIDKATFFADNTGSHTVTYQVENGVCVASTQRVLEIEEVATPTAQFRIVEDRICNGSNATLEFSNITGRFPIDVSYTDGESEFSSILNNSLEKIIVTPTGASSASYTLNTLIDVEGCDNTLNTSDDVILDVVPNPVVDFYDEAFCGDEANVSVTLYESNKCEWKVVADESDGSGLYFEDRTMAETKAYVNSNEQQAYEYYLLELTEINVLNESCTGSDGVLLELYKKPIISLGAPDTTGYLDKAIFFSTLGLEGLPYEWDFSNGLNINDERLDKVIVSGLLSGLNEVICTVENGTCPIVEATKEITILDLYQTTGFSPNGDFTNETFIIGGAHNISNNTFTVYDMSGKVVFQEENFCHVDPDGDPDGDEKIGWDGNSNAGPCPEGTYYYTFKGDELVKPIQNYLILKRSKP